MILLCKMDIDTFRFIENHRCLGLYDCFINFALLQRSIAYRSLCGYLVTVQYITIDISSTARVDRNKEDIFSKYVFGLPERLP